MPVILRELATRDISIKEDAFGLKFSASPGALTLSIFRICNI